MSSGSGALAMVAVALALGGCPGGGGPHKGPDAARERTVTIFGLAEMRGQIEPCGCTTNPLGDLARTDQLVADARARGATVVVDAGSLLYTAAKVPEARLPQEQLKSDLLADVYANQLQVAAVGVGANDLAEGAARVRPARQAANVAADAGIATEAPKVIDAGGARIGVFGVTSIEGAGDATAAAKQAIADLKAQKADVVVALLAMSRKDAKQLLGAAPGVDFAIAALGGEAPEPDKVSDRAEQVDGAWLVVPANRGQVISRLELTLRGTGAFIDAVGPAAARALGAQLDARIAAAEKELAGFEADPSADQAFVAKKKEELAEVKAQRAKLAEQPLQVPADGRWFTLEQIRVDRALACDAKVQSAKTAYDQAAGAANVAAAKAKPAPAPLPADKASFVGSEACSDCHDEESEFWSKTRHAQAWKTLEEVGKQFDYDCIGCHVTGWDEPGGSSMASNDDLRDVQCEVCHGPGSLHVEATDKAVAKATIRRSPPDDLCANSCHIKEHSDTFDFVPYLRDIVGSGHGGKRRKAIGDGTTGRELRAAGLAKAAQTVGAGCIK